MLSRMPEFIPSCVHIPLRKLQGVMLAWNAIMNGYVGLIGGPNNKHLYLT